jgi:hypothetical protein
MNPDANQNAANSPTAPVPPPPTNTTGPAAPSGLKSTLKVVVPLAALVGVVFGITYLSQYTTPKDDPVPNGTDVKSSGEPPLRFFTSARHWDPPLLSAPGYRNLPLLAPSAVASAESDGSYSLQDRVFQGFYEWDANILRRTQFWFENRNPNSVTLQLKGVSCSACTGGRLVALPQEVTRELFQHTALATLPLGAFRGYGVGLVGPAAKLDENQGRIHWTTYPFETNPHATFNVPAATNPDKWAPYQWGILELTFKALAKPGDPVKTLQAVFATQVEGTAQSGKDQFVIAYESALPCDLSRRVLDLGRIDPLSGDREYEVILYSSTRGPGSEFGDLQPPSSVVETPSKTPDPVKFVEVTKVERVPEADLVAVAERLASEHKRLTRVRAAYRLTVAVRPKVGETRMDLGLFERTLALSAGEVTVPMAIRGMVRGPVWMDNDRTDIEFGSFNRTRGITQVVDLYTERTGLDLVVVTDECRAESAPKFPFETTLEKQPDRGGQGHYRLKIVIPPDKSSGYIKGVVVLEVKGTNSQRLRIPFKGTSEYRQ